MKKIPSPEFIAELDKIEADGRTRMRIHCPEFYEDFEDWCTDYRIPRRDNMGLLEDFFDWYELSQTPLYKALNEED